MLKLQSQPIKQQTINFLGWAVGRLDGWTVGRLGGWAVGRLDGWAVGRLDGWAVGRLDGWTVRQSYNNLFTDSQLNYCEIYYKLNDLHFKLTVTDFYMVFFRLDLVQILVVCTQFNWPLTLRQ